MGMAKSILRSFYTGFVKCDFLLNYTITITNI